MEERVSAVGNTEAFHRRAGGVCGVGGTRGVLVGGEGGSAINRSSIIRHDSKARIPLGHCAYYLFSVSAMSFCNLSYFAQFMCFFIYSLSTAANILLCTETSFCTFTK